MILDHPSLLDSVNATLLTPATRASAADILTALCILSPERGYQAVISSLDRTPGVDLEAIVARFDPSPEVNPSTDGEPFSLEVEASAWAWRCSCLRFLNALVAAAPDDERVAMRLKLGRYGITSALQVRPLYFHKSAHRLTLVVPVQAIRSCDPPAETAIQLDLYARSAQEDLRDASAALARLGDGYVQLSDACRSRSMLKSALTACRNTSSSPASFFASSTSFSIVSGRSTSESNGP